MRLPRPVYEAFRYVYIAIGVARRTAASFAAGGSPAWSDDAGVFGWSAC